MATIYDTVTASILRQLEAGAKGGGLPWHRNGAAQGVPFNAATGKAYQGANVLALWCEAQGRQYESPVWATYKQWQALGAQVRKGERSVSCIKWKAVEDKRRPADAEDSGRPVLIGLGFSVFNAAQVDGWDGAMPEGVDTSVKFNPIERAELIASATGADISHGGTRAFYRPSTDTVVMPDKFRFVGTETMTAAEGYYATLFHELAHWTAPEKRCGREVKCKRFGDNAYAFEELVAELGAAFILARLGITNEPRADHAQYLASWIKVLKDDNRAIFSAASMAQKAADFICNRLAAPSAERPADAAPLLAAA
jgi:antirestriction protein ArdC